MGNLENNKGVLQIGKSLMQVMDRTGDTKYVWDRNNETDVAVARAAFNEAKKRGHIAFKVDKEGNKTAEQITEFDPNLERIIMAPPMRGG